MQMSMVKGERLITCLNVDTDREEILNCSGQGRGFGDRVPGGCCHMSPCPGAVPCLRQTTGKVLAVTRHCAPHRYDDYDYAEVNQLLERMLKVYIKTVTCYPEKTNSEMFDRFWKQFKHSEKVG